ncbi:MAG: hypothetical protein L3J28_06615 [Candidatus Polarisedimenticolaceae bacterium]|nr:hypothetical protein [Candidatus Polarisedimenticolaceae bacterium]
MIRFFASHPTAANVLMIAIIILGLTALPKLQRDTFPVIRGWDPQSFPWGHSGRG